MKEAKGTGRSDEGSWCRQREGDIVQDGTSRNLSKRGRMRHFTVFAALRGDARVMVDHNKAKQPRGGKEREQRQLR
jgi:hypothetical protein